jgi:hypothetical protein
LELTAVEIRQLYTPPFMNEPASPEPTNLLLEIESRQDEVLRLLDELEAQLQRTLREGQIHLAPQSLPERRAA